MPPLELLSIKGLQPGARCTEKPMIQLPLVPPPPTYPGREVHKHFFIAVASFAGTIAENKAISS